MVIRLILAQLMNSGRPTETGFLPYSWSAGTVSHSIINNDDSEPYMKAAASDAVHDEEQRLKHAGGTREKKWLTLTCASKKGAEAGIYGMNRPPPISFQCQHQCCCANTTSD